MKVRIKLYGTYPNKQLWVGEMASIPRVGELVCVSENDASYRVHEVTHFCRPGKGEAVLVMVKS